ncbi:hypothetical protein AB6F61_10565 [Providencia hangzhouensis]
MATVVAAEMIAANSGIGYRINDALITRYFPVVIVGICYRYSRFIIR